MIKTQLIQMFQNLRISLILILILGCVSCGENKVGNISFDYGDYNYFHTLYDDNNTLFEINGDSLSMYKLEDSIFTPNVLNISRLDQEKDGRYSISLNDTVFWLNPFRFDNGIDMDYLYGGHWELKKDSSKRWFRFMPKINLSSDVYKGMYDVNWSNESFSATYIGNVFEKFNFIRTTGVDQSLRLVTRLNKDTLRLYDFQNQKITHLTKFNDEEGMSSGIWNYVDTEFEEDRIPEKFELFQNNTGVIKKGYCKNDSLYYFTSIRGESLFMIIKNDVVSENILEFLFLDGNSDTLYNNQISYEKTLKFVKK